MTTTRPKPSEAIFAMIGKSPEKAKANLENALDCYFCGMRCDAMFPPEIGGFNSFERLAQHTLYCPWSPVPRGDDLAYAAAKILAANRVRDEEMRKGKPMGKNWIPPAPTADAGDDLPGFLGAKHLGKINKSSGDSPIVKVKITGFQELEPSQFDPKSDRFGLKVLFQKKERVIPIKVNSVNHRILGDLFGKAPRKWIGKIVSICARKGKFPNPFIAFLNE